jgi:ribosome-associated heat shock protein Hsp15
MIESRQSQRIDKWIWHARLAKTRGLAQKMVASGKVRLDRAKVVSASQSVKPGQVLTVTTPKQVRIIEIVGFAERRGPYSEAKLLYNDLTPQPQPEATDSSITSNPVETDKQKRPNSRDRRFAIRMKQGSTDL